MALKKLHIAFCKDFSKTVSQDHIKFILERAKNDIKDWTVPSRQNKGISRGSFWNALHCNKVLKSDSSSSIVKYRMLVEFGEYLPERLKPVMKKKTEPKVIHQDPIFEN